MQAIHTNSAPAAIGMYSQAMRCGDTVYLSGQIPLDPKTMMLVEGNFTDQISQVLANLSAVCQAAGGSLANIVKLNVYLTDLSCFPLVNEIMAMHFNEPYPARAVLGVRSLPRNAQVEIDGIMVLNSRTCS